MKRNKIVFLYPGQGAQEIGMGFDLLQSHPRAAEIFQHADDVLGYRLSRLCFEGPEDRLSRDLEAQLAVYTVSCVITRILEDEDVHPDMVTGYSSGFYAAAFAAGCFSFEQGLKIVKKAGEILLEETSSIHGAMAVIFGLSRDAVEDICLKAGSVDVAIINTPSQIIISGPDRSIINAMATARAQGALDAYLLPVSAAYHSRWAETSGSRLLDVIDGDPLEDPSVPLISYLTLEPVKDRFELKKILAEQLHRPVFWADLVKKLGGDLVTFIEAGPGTVLSRTVRWIDRNAEILNTHDTARIREAVQKVGRKGHDGRSCAL